MGTISHVVRIVLVSASTPERGAVVPENVPSSHAPPSGAPSATVTPAPATNEQPNILLIMADQLVPFLTGPYGDAVVRTPNLDRLAAHGVTFDAAYTPYPLCSPARAAFMTGDHASSFGCYDNAALFPADRPTFAHYLDVAGYRTALTGKMHFVGPDQRHGFAERLNPDIFPAGFDWLPEVDENGQFPRGGHAHDYVPPGVGVRTWTRFLTYDEETTHHAVDFIRERALAGIRDTQEPWLLVASLHHPHDPFHVTEQMWQEYADVEVGIPEPEPDLPINALDRWLNEAHDTTGVDLADPDALRTLRRAYYALVSYVDRKIGAMLDAVEETGQASDTVIMVTADHGDMLGERRMVQKRCFYEWSVRVPLLITRPGEQNPGRRCAEPVTLVDLAPTILDLAQVPQGQRTPMHGASLVPLLDGEPWDREAIYSEYHVEKVHASGYMVRSGTLKYVYVHGHDRQLFDLAGDPGERHDLAGDPERAADLERMHALLLDQFDPIALDTATRESVRRRAVIRDAMATTGTRWDFAGAPPPATRYVR
nr:choline-sulfatase [Ruania halotolerans]